MKPETCSTIRYRHRWLQLHKRRRAAVGRCLTLTQRLSCSGVSLGGSSRSLQSRWMLQALSKPRRAENLRAGSGAISNLDLMPMATLFLARSRLSTRAVKLEKLCRRLQPQNRRLNSEHRRWNLSSGMPSKPRRAENLRAGSGAISNLDLMPMATLFLARSRLSTRAVKLEKLCPRLQCQNRRLSSGGNHRLRAVT